MNYQVSRGRFIWCVIVCLSVVGFTAPALADVISYSTQVAEDVVFDDIYEESLTDPLPLYGSPTTNHNSLVFYSVSLNAASLLASPPVDVTDGKLSMVIASLEGIAINTIRVWEAGDYTLAGFGTVATQACVSTPLFVTIMEVNGQPITPIALNQQMVFSPKASGDFNLVADPGVGVIWEGESTLDIAAALAAEEIEGGATKVALSLDNTLVAVSEAASVALIMKKQFGIDVNIVVIPEPSVVALLVCGCCALLARRRCRI